MNKENRIKELEDLIINAKKKYYSMTDDIDIEMSDAEYDLLEDELRQLDPNNKVIKLYMMFLCFLWIKSIQKKS